MERSHQDASTDGQERRGPASDPADGSGPGAGHEADGSLAANPLARALYFALGCLTFTLAMIGIVVRGIPTTPLLLVTAFAFARSSPRLHRWLLEHPRFGPILSDLRSGRGLTLRFKVATITFSWSLMLATAIWLVPSWPLRAFMALAAAIQLYVFVRVIPTRAQHA